MKNESTYIRFGKVSEDAATWSEKSADFAAAMRFLGRGDLAQISLGRYELTPTAFALVQESELHPLAGRMLFHAEVHARYIDIQMPIDGEETQGVCEIPARFEPFDVEKDVGFDDRAMELVTLHPGEFAVYFPEKGAHAPCQTQAATPQLRRKVVIKIEK